MLTFAEICQLDREGRLEKALRFAKVAHGKQTYKDGLPYYHHLLDVQNVMVRHGYDDLLYRMEAALLHDTIEDTSVTYEDLLFFFGKEVADLVQLVTNEPGKNRAERHAATYPGIAAHSDAVLLKLCDRIANVEASLDDPKGKLKMYAKEMPAFRSYLYKPGQYENLWAELALLDTPVKKE